MNHHNRDVELKWKDLGDNGINSSLSIRTAAVKVCRQ